MISYITPVSRFFGFILPAPDTYTNFDSTKHRYAVCTRRSGAGPEREAGIRPPTDGTMDGGGGNQGGWWQCSWWSVLVARFGECFFTSHLLSSFIHRGLLTQSVGGRAYIRRRCFDTPCGILPTCRFFDTPCREFCCLGLVNLETSLSEIETVTTVASMTDCPDIFPDICPFPIVMIVFNPSFYTKKSRAGRGSPREVSRKTADTFSLAKIDATWRTPVPLTSLLS